MARSIQQIKNELALIEKTVTEVAVTLYDANTKYLNLLSNLGGKQLTISVYQLCTQIYPDAFLELPYAKREKLQQNLRTLTKKLETLLLVNFNNSTEKEQNLDEKLAADRANNLNIVEQMLDELSTSVVEEEREDDDEDEDEMDEFTEDDDEMEEFTEELKLQDWQSQIETELTLTEIELPDTLEESTETEEAIVNTEQARQQIESINDPEQLWQWQKRVEKGIKKALEKISRQVNRCLQEQGILSDRLPTQILDAAVQAEETASAASSVSNFPNILNLVIETGNTEKSKKTNVTQVTLLRLRLSEIEFAEPTLSVERNQIRSVVAKIEQLRQQYRKKQRECKIAEAEAAWRSSWYEN
jgi:hypothetical protein